MIKRKVQIITSPFGYRIRDGKKEFHNGVDLRSVNALTDGVLLPVVLPENSYYIAHGRDAFGNNYIIFKNTANTFIFTFVHVKINKLFVLNKIYLKGDEIGFTEIGGNSAAHHLHFKVDSVNNRQSTLFNPVDYFRINSIKYEKI